MKGKTMPRTKTKLTKIHYEPVLKLPPHTPEEYAGLRDNIAVNGVLVPILVNCDGPRRKIIDGNYRKQFADEFGYECPEIVHSGLNDEEMRTLARALNLARRRLTTDQKRELIADQLRETPGKSLRWYAKMLGVHHTTVGSVRAEMASTGELASCPRTEGLDGKSRPTLGSVSRAKEYWADRPTGLKRYADNLLDFHPTPEYITEGLLARERFHGSILEPASGDGAIIRVLKRAGYTVTGTDIVDGTDFLKTKKAVANIITNPPYSEGMSEKFCRHALALAKAKVAMLLPIWLLEGVQRHDLFTKQPLKAIYIFSRRPTFSHDNSAPFGTCWAVWDKGYKGKARIEWILE